MCSKSIFGLLFFFDNTRAAQTNSNQLNFLINFCFVNRFSESVSRNLSSSLRFFSSQQILTK